jgi:hypothetical protein
MCDLVIFVCDRSAHFLAGLTHSEPLSLRTLREKFLSLSTRVTLYTMTIL